MRNNYEMDGVRLELTLGVPILNKKYPRYLQRKKQISKKYYLPSGIIHETAHLLKAKSNKKIKNSIITTLKAS